MDEALCLGYNFYSVRIGDGMKKRKKSGSDGILATLSLAIAILAFGMDIYSLELLSNLEIGESWMVEKIANGMYVLAILLMIYVAGENQK